MKFSLYVLVAFMFVTGCATHAPLLQVPSEIDAFSLPKDQLDVLYTDVPLYEKQWRGLSPNFPLMESVDSVLGEPKVVKRDWWYPIIMVGTLAAISADPITWGHCFGSTPGCTKN